MSIFYDPHSRQPKAWTYIFIIILPLLIFSAFYFYGEKKAKDLPSEEPRNAFFEDAAE